MVTLGTKSATERLKQSPSCWREIASPPLCDLFSEQMGSWGGSQ